MVLAMGPEEGASVLFGQFLHGRQMLQVSIRPHIEMFPMWL